MEYKIARTYTTSELEIEVQALIEKGWKLQGGICATNNEFYQAMVKGE